MKKFLFILWFSCSLNAARESDFESAMINPSVLPDGLCKSISIQCTEMTELAIWRHFHELYFAPDYYPKEQSLLSAFMEKHRVVVFLNVKNLKSQNPLFSGLAGKYFVGAPLHDEVIAKLDISYGQLMFADLSNVDASETQFDYANCYHTNFAGANLTDASFNGTNLRKAQFDDAYYVEHYQKFAVTKSWLKKKGALVD